MLCSCGIGVELRRAAVVTPEMERKLWSLGVLGKGSATTPESVQDLLN